jgi:hypothetical protein
MTMSSGLNIWDPACMGGIPKTFEEANAVFQEFDANELIGINPKIIHFAEAIERIVRADFEFQEDLQDCFTDIVKAAQRNQKAIFRVGLPHDAHVVGMDIVIRAATENGLVVFDENLHAVFLPDGSVQPPDKAEMWLGALDYLRNPEENYPLKIKEFRQLILPKITQLVEKNGMTAAKLSFIDSAGYSRQCGGVTQYLITEIEGGGGVYRFQIFIYLCFEPINEIYNQTLFHPKKYIFNLIVPEKLNQYGNQFKSISSAVELASFLQMLELTLFPKILDVAKNIQGLDQLMNGDYMERILNKRKILSLFYPQRLIAARLAGNPRFEQLVEEYGQESFGRNSDHQLTEWPKLVQYLRDEVKPIL